MHDSKNETSKGCAPNGRWTLSWEAAPKPQHWLHSPHSLSSWFFKPHSPLRPSPPGASPSLRKATAALNRRSSSGQLAVGEGQHPMPLPASSTMRSRCCATHMRTLGALWLEQDRSAGTQRAPLTL